MSHELVRVKTEMLAERSVEEVVDQVQKIQRIMQAVMREGEHYGRIPGCGPKPSLLKPGAEKLGFTFRLAPKFYGENEPRELQGGHREYIIRCDLQNINTGQFWGSGVGSCSTLESKYRYRTGPKQGTGKPVPKEYWDLRRSDPQQALALLGGKGHVVGKNEHGQWEIQVMGEPIENPNPADHYNTVLKMAKKRAHVDAVLTASAASDIFTQDLEDLELHRPEEEPIVDEPPYDEKPLGAPPPAQPAPAPSKPVDPEIISQAQRRRLFAITQESKTPEHVIKGILKEHGYESSKQIKKKDYDAICEWAKNWQGDPPEWGEETNG